MSPGLPRALDALAAGVGLVVAAPVLLVAGAAVKLTSPGPVLFRQVRVGRGGKPFTMLKLRSMTAGGTGPAVTARGDLRVNAVGRLLRRMKLDELPELWNVLCGDMALVGPRPEVPALVDLGDPLWRDVLSARPGLTDPVTLRLRNEEELLATAGGDPELFYRQELQPWKLRGYRDFLSRRTPWSDLRTLLATALGVLWPSLTLCPTLTEVRGEQGRASALRGLAAATGFLTGPPPRIESALADLAIAEGMGPLLGARCAAGELEAATSEARGHLVAQHLACLARETVREEELEALRLALARATVPAVLIKGAALARSVYSRPGTRPMSDVDVLVPADRWREAAGAAAAAGLVPSVCRGRRLTAALDRERSFAGDHLLVELQRAPAPSLLFPVDCTGIFARATRHPDGWLLPDPHDSFVLAAVHASLHGLHLPFRWLADGLGLAQDDQLAPDTVVARAIAWRARRATAVWIFALVGFGLPERTWGDAARELAQGEDLSGLVRLAERPFMGESPLYLSEVRRLRHLLVDADWRAWTYHARGAALLAGDIALRPFERFLR